MLIFPTMFTLMDKGLRTKVGADKLAQFTPKCLQIEIYLPKPKSLRFWWQKASLAVRSYIDLRDILGVLSGSIPEKSDTLWISSFFVSEIFTKVCWKGIKYFSFFITRTIVSFFFTSITFQTEKSQSLQHNSLTL